jgi:hypothetical protein
VSTGDEFYRDLEPFHHFVEEVFQRRFYRPLPADWLLVITDISGSTRAVEAGKYAEVNYVGAACIVAVHNALPQHDVPCVFGGDGATLAIPPSLRAATVDALSATQRWARNKFGLELRVGVVPVADLASQGAAIEVAKMEFSPNNSMAMFRGTGFDVADALVKGDDGTGDYRVDAPLSGTDQPDLQSLSCRWAPMLSENGVGVSLIIAAREPDILVADGIYRDVLGVLDQITTLDSEQASPVKMSRLRARLRFDAMMKEVKTVTGPLWQRWLRVLVQHIAQVIVFRFSLRPGVAQVIVFRFSLRPGVFEPEQYKREMTVNADFKKVSGMLRMITDCTVAQANQIETALGKMHADRLIHFGTHRSDQAIMTCVTPNVDNHEHVHFIDGGDGGLYRAAGDLKKQIASNAG